MILVQPLTEKQFQKQVTQYARLRGWHYYHTYDSRRSVEGFPDLVLVRNDRVIYAELKSDRGRTTPQQEHWMRLLRQARQEIYLWRPKDWSEIESTLT